MPPFHRLTCTGSESRVEELRADARRALDAKLYDESCAAMEALLAETVPAESVEQDDVPEMEGLVTLKLAFQRGLCNILQALVPSDLGLIVAGYLSLGLESALCSTVLWQAKSARLVVRGSTRNL